MSASLDAIKLRHLRLSEEESNSCGLCVANMLPMDFETKNTVKNWKEEGKEGEKRGGKLYSNFSRL